MGKSPTKTFFVSKSFYRKFVKDFFEVIDPKNRGFWAFLHQVGKKVFFEISFFLKKRGDDWLFWECALKMFLQVCTTHVACFQFRNEGDRW